jgi:hypothetical protein
MYAVVVEVDILDDAEARKELENVVATVKEFPGLVAGHWVRLDERHGTSFVLFETEEQANAAKPPAGGDAAGVKMTSIRVGEVLASV